MGRSVVEEFKQGEKIKIKSGGYASIIKKLGQGGQGIVYEVEYAGKRYALKWYQYNKIKNPTDKVIELAINQAGWAIKYAKNPSEELQLLAVRKNYDSIKFIKNPYESVQKEAIKISYDALRYINSPSHNIEIEAIKNNEAAISFIHNLDKDKILNFLKENILVIKYVAREISKEDLEEVLKEVLSKEDVEEKYVRDFLNCSMIDRNSKNFEIDKIMFIYKYGSKKARKIAVDEKLKMI